MNKIYKLVWSKVRNTWVVASEIAKGHGKSSSSEGNGKLLKSLVLTALLGSFMTAGISPVAAELTPDQQEVYDAVLQKLETEKKTVHYFSVNSGEPANPAGANWNNNGATGQDAIAIGFGTSAQGGSSIALGYAAHAKEEGATALGYVVRAEGKTSTALGYATHAKGDFSTTIGAHAYAEGTSSTAVGHATNAVGDSSTALGYATYAKGDFSTTIGAHVYAVGTSSMALGNYSQAYGNQSQATGKNAWSIGGYSQASGYNAVAAAEKGIDAATYNALSDEEKENYKLNTQSEGTKNTSLYYRTKFKEYTNDEFNALSAMERYILESEQGYTFDKEKQVWSRSPGAVAIGHAAKAIGVSTLAVGDLAEATGKHAVAVGREAEAADVGTTALGHYAKAKGLRSTALGVATRATDFESTAVGPYAWAEGKVSLALGSKANAKGNNSIAMGLQSKSTGESSIALGGKAKTQAQGSVAIGMMAESRQNGGVALGEVSLADREAGVWGLDISTGKAMNEDALLGAGKADYDAAKAKLTELQGQAQKLRNDYQASLAQDPVAPNGNHIPSAATQAIGNQLKAKEGEVFAQAIQVNDFVKAWKATTGAVSVGNTELAATRQITGVAAGTEDTDAVNVAQLKGVNTKVEQNTTNITNLGTKVEQNTTNITNLGTKVDNNTTKITTIEQNITTLNTKVGKSGVHNFSVNSGEPANPAGTNWNNDGATGRFATAVGPWAKASSDNSLAVGVSSSATHVESTAVGSFVKAEGAKSAAFGTEAHAKGDTSIAIGPNSESIGKTSIALGGRAKSQADGSVSIGMMAESRQAGSVALGAGSIADRKADVWGLDISTGQAMNEDTLLGAGKAAYDEAKVKLTELQGQAQTLEREYHASLAQDPKGPNGYPVESAATQAIKNKLDAKMGEVFAKTMEVKNAVNTWSATEGAISVGSTERAITRQITGVAAGKEDTDAVNVAQLKKVAAMAKSATVDIEAGDNVTVNKDATTGKYKISAKDTNTYTTKATYDAGSRKLTFTRNDNKTYDVDLSGIAGSITGDTRNTIAESDTIGVDSTQKNADGSINYKLNVKTDGKVEKDNTGIVTGGTVYKETRIEKDGNYIKKNNTAGENLSALDKQVGINAKDINALGKKVDVNTGNINKNKEDINILGKKVDINTGNISKNKEGINALGKEVGINKENINKNTETINILGTQVGSLDTRVDKVGAGAAALAGLHPLDYDPENKWDFAAGYGNYNGANAIAIGAFYRPDENKMISIGGSFGGGENMISAGISVKVGQGTGISTSKAAMANEIRELKARDREREAQMQEIMRQLEILRRQAGK